MQGKTFVWRQAAYRLNDQLEHQANLFAANLLLPLDDFRCQMAAGAAIELDAFSHCAGRYRVSLIAATVRWLSMSTRST